VVLYGLQINADDTVIPLTADQLPSGRTLRAYDDNGSGAGQSTECNESNNQAAMSFTC
jgi:hypothetical protein